MPEPADYQAAAHFLARGRAHRLRFQEIPVEVDDPDTECVGSWVPLDVWVAAEEVAPALARAKIAEEKEQLERKKKGGQADRRALSGLLAIAAVATLAYLVLAGCVGPDHKYDPPGRSHDGRPVYWWQTTESYSCPPR